MKSWALKGKIDETFLQWRLWKGDGNILKILPKIDFSRVERDIPLEKDIIQSQIFFISPSEAPPPVEHWLRFRHFFVESEGRC